MEIDGYKTLAGVSIFDGKTKVDSIVEATEMTYGKDWENKLKDPMAQDILVPTTSVNPQTSLADSEHGSENLVDVDVEDESYGDFEELYDHDDFSCYDETLHVQAQFDAADLPPGVEASVPWLEEHAKTQTNSAATCSYSICQVSEGEEEEVLKKYKQFKQFDTVEDFSDHHYCIKQGSKPVQASKQWTKTIHRDWKILEEGLPDTIFVRVYEERMDILRAVIIGAAGTPYHDGLFFFDLFFPPGYPNEPPKAYYHSGGLRLNPNLYDSGYVCLSLLNTWEGRTDEKWTPGISTVLQVLLSIQALVLNERPYFNEPGCEDMAGSREGEIVSKVYNENTFVLSCKTMLYSLRNPPKNFEDLVVGHFREHAQAILEACKAYIKGVQVGLPIDSEVQPVEESYRKSPFLWGVDINEQDFKTSLRIVIAGLIPAFIKNGAMHCEKFIPLGDVNRTAPLKL